MIITRAPSVNYPEKLLEFGVYGIGVSLQHPDGQLETLVEPRPWRTKHTPEAWWFAETAYGQFLDQQSSPYASTPRPSPAPCAPGRRIWLMSASTATRRAYREVTTRQEDQPMSTHPDHGPLQADIVAYKHPELADALLCPEHGEGWAGLIPLTIHDVPYGRFCSWGTDDDMTVCGNALPMKKRTSR